jgi:hypothetical protein
MVVHLAGHTIDVLGDILRQFGASCCSGAIGFLRQQCERSLEAVSEVSRSGEAAFNGLFPIFEQRVQFVNQRLDFAWIRPLNPPIQAHTNSRQSFPQPPEWHQAPAQSEQSRGH